MICPKCKREVFKLRGKLVGEEMIYACTACTELHPRVHDGDGHVWDSSKPYEHINVTGEGPMRFQTKGDMRRYCKQNHIECGALL